MTVDQLLAAGFTVSAGQIDRNNVNYGYMSREGPVLTPAGFVLANDLWRAELAATKPRRRAAAKTGADDSGDIDG